MGGGGIHSGPEDGSGGVAGGGGAHSGLEDGVRRGSGWRWGPRW